MRARVYEFWELARSSFWLVPSLMMLVGLILFGITLTIDELQLTGSLLHTLFYSGGTSNATSLLQTLTAAMVAIATVVFSTMMVVLTLATSQFGHHLIHSFMRDRANQTVLGIFLATFVYCMLVFHMVGNDPKNQFVPSVSLSVGFVLALFATCTLIYFTHHMAQLFSAPEVLETVGVEFDQTIDRMYPAGAHNGDQGDGIGAPELGHGTQDVIAHGGGYVQEIGTAALLEIAGKYDVVIESRVSYGDYLMPGNVLARVHGAELDDETARHAAHEYVLGKNRMVDHDLVFAVNQMAEIGVRALSPALNNPFTALDCVNRIGCSLAVLISRPLPSEVITDPDGEMRLIIHLPNFHDLVDAAFMPIRNYGRESVITMREMLRVIEKLAPLTRRDLERRALAHHAEAILEAAGHGLSEHTDIERIRACFCDTRRALAAVGEILPAEPDAE